MTTISGLSVRNTATLLPGGASTAMPEPAAGGVGDSADCYTRARRPSHTIASTAAAASGAACDIQRRRRAWRRTRPTASSAPRLGVAAANAPQSSRSASSIRCAARRHRAKQLRHDLPHLRLLHSLHRILPGRRLRLGLSGHVVREPQSGREPPTESDRCVAGDLVQPGREPRAPGVAVQSGVQTDQHLLRDFVRVVRVAGVHQRPAVHGRMAASQQLVPGSGVAGLGAPHEGGHCIVQLPGVAQPVSGVTPREGETRDATATFTAVSLATQPIPSWISSTVGSSSGALVYAVLRTVVAIVLVFAAAFGGRRAWPLVGQAVSDVACLACMIAYVDAELRLALGWLALPLVLYVVGWEGWGALRAAGRDSDTAADGVGAELLDWLGGFWRLLFRILLVVPPVGAGMFLVLGLLYPGGWVFPSMPAPLSCTPATVARGDTRSEEHTSELQSLT